MRRQLGKCSQRGLHFLCLPRLDPHHFIDRAAALGRAGHEQKYSCTHGGHLYKILSTKYSTLHRLQLVDEHPSFPPLPPAWFTAPSLLLLCCSARLWPPS